MSAVLPAVLSAVRRLLPLFLMAALVLPLTPAPAQAVTEDVETLLRRGVTTVERIREDENMRARLDELLPRARAVLVVPDFFKAGFIVGGAYGTGAMMVRGEDRAWSDPAFYQLYAGSLGLQIGVQGAQMLFVVMTEEGLQALLRNEFKLGATAGVAFGLVGAGLEASAARARDMDIYAFYRAAGAYGGGALEGTVIRPREGWNWGYYGRGTTPRDVLFRPPRPVAAADSLRQALDR